MSSTSPLLHPEPPLPIFTEEQRTVPAIHWYRSPLPPGAMKKLHERSDRLGAWQTFGHLSIYTLTAAVTIWASWHGPWWLTVIGLFLFGTVNSFMINAVHELGHGTVFKTKSLNVFFEHVFAFLGWFNHEVFEVSHARHHRYTLHPPDDLEVVLPNRVLIRHFFLYGFLNLRGSWNALQGTARLACGRFQGEWELTLYPASAPDQRRVPVRWSRVILAGYALIAVVSAWFGWWMVPVLFCVPNFCGGWLQFLCNNTQHIGLQDNVSDFRLCCRTFKLNPLTRLLYWQMNYHTEHHMYAAVPCYNLGKLHDLIEGDLPPTPNGLVEVWREIATIQSRQEADPSYCHVVALPLPASSKYQIPGKRPLALSGQTRDQGNPAPPDDP